MMEPSIREELNEKAHFVAGRHAWIREHADPKARAAVRDAEDFLGRLPKDLDRPTISAGTTAHPERIVTLTWLVSGYSTIKAVSISFSGDGRCDVQWDTPHGRSVRKHGIAVDDLAALDVPGTIRSLIAHRSSCPSTVPRYS